MRGEEPATAVKPGLESGVDPRGGPQPHDVGLVEARVGHALDAREGADRQPPQPGRSLVEDTLARPVTRRIDQRYPPHAGGLLRVAAT